MLCAFCSKETNNPKYCCRSCSAKDTNKKFKKRKLTKKCLNCGELVVSSRDKCPKCIMLTTSVLDNSTLFDIQDRLAVKGKHPSWKNAVLRQHCRKVNKDRLKQCQNCGYSKHVECCHITPVSSFPLSATLQEINTPDNVYVLCRNCHWEQENGLWSSPKQ